MTKGPEKRHKATGLVVQVAATRWFLPLGGVVEVLRAPTLARVPGAPATVLGLVNHRGRVLTVADPVRALELAGAGCSAADVVVVELGVRRFAIGVDAVIELVGRPRTGLATLELERVAKAVFGDPT